jgi:hypothetical protein
LIPYKVWEAITDSDPVPRTFGMWIAFVATVLLASAACALSVGWGLNLLGFVPFSVLGNIVLINNFLVAVVLTPFLLAVIYPRVNGQLVYRDDAAAAPPRWVPTRACAMVVATVGGMVWQPPVGGSGSLLFLPHGLAASNPRGGGGSGCCRMHCWLRCPPGLALHAR